MLNQRLRAILYKHMDGRDTGIDEVAQDEVDDAIGAAERNCGFTPCFGEREEPFAFSSGHDHGECSDRAHQATTIVISDRFFILVKPLGLPNRRVRTPSDQGAMTIALRLWNIRYLSLAVGHREIAKEVVSETRVVDL